MALTVLRRALVAASLGLLLVVVPASADVYVPAGHTSHYITVVGTNVRIDGITTGRVTVIDGDLTVGATGQVRGGATLIGGQLHTHAGGVLSGDFFNIGGSWPHLTSPQLGLLVAALLGIRLLLVGIAIACADLLRRKVRLAPLTETLRERPLRTVTIGILSGFGIGTGALLLTITVVGLVVAAALWGVLLIATVIGLALWLDAVGDDPSGRRLVFIVASIPLIGDAIAACSTIAGLGALLRYASDVRPRLHPRRALSP